MAKAKGIQKAEQIRDQLVRDRDLIAEHILRLEAERDAKLGLIEQIDDLIAHMEAPTARASQPASSPLDA